MIVHKKVLWITRTALFIAITVALQALTLQFGNQLLTGSIVNMILILAVMICGLPTGLTVGVITPVLPTLLGFGPLWPIVPIIIIGNMALASIWHFIGKIAIPIENISYIIALIIAALIKFLILYFGVALIALPLIPGLSDMQITTITGLFSYPQLITASIGGGLAIILLPALKRAILRDK
ncbi:MAG: hypothetical protein FWH17_03885 [Oscillospiraceae bacterium]|nr:hypothetical protein [Oscillospiraceae bacterium]